MTLWGYGISSQANSFTQETAERNPGKQGITGEISTPPSKTEFGGGGEPSEVTGLLVPPWHSAPVGDPHVVPRVVPLVPDARGMAVRVRRARLRAW